VLQVDLEEEETINKDMLHWPNEQKYTERNSVTAMK